LAGLSVLHNSTRYSREISDEICARTIAGESIAEICRDPEMPSESAFYKWLAENRDGIVERYARAKDIQADMYFESIISISDEVAGCTDNAQVQAARLRVDARKWTASKLAPKKYGDRIEHVGAGGRDLIPARQADLHLTAQAVQMLIEGAVASPAAAEPQLPHARAHIDNSIGEDDGDGGQD
jgi:hypothetical protein